MRAWLALWLLCLPLMLSAQTAQPLPEDPLTNKRAMHLATVEVFEPSEDGFDYARLVALVGDRLAFVPRYRQRLLHVPGGVARPVWVDDEDFDLAYHVRLTALPRPGSEEQLKALLGRL